MSEMVERVARTLALVALKKAAEGHDELAGQCQWTLRQPAEAARHVEFTWGNHVAAAEAAIQAMRESTSRMDTAGAEAIDLEGLSPEVCATTFAAMIDAALKD